MDNYLMAESLIISRLTNEVPELKGNVFSAADLAGVSEATQKTPAAHVLYFGDRIVDGTGRSTTGEVQCVDQGWYVVLVVRNVRSQLTGEDARSDAGPLAKKILKALQGWQPSPEHGHMKRVNGANPGFKAGYLYLPFFFQSRITI